jgi:hypothetical protein
MFDRTSARLRVANVSLFFFATAVLFASPTQALVVDYGTLSFESENQSIWKTGTAGGFDESVFVGTTWDTPEARVGKIFENTISTPGVAPILITPEIPRTLITPAIPSKTIVKAKRVCVPFVGCATTPAVKTPYIPAVYSPRIPAVYTPAIPPIELTVENGAAATAKTSGKIGLEFSVEADAGSLDTDAAFDAQLVVPDEVRPLEFFALTSVATAGPQQFETTFPNLEARADFVIDISAEIGGEVCVASACVSGTEQLGTNGEVRQELISLNQDGNGQFRLLGDDNLTPSAFNFGTPIPFGTFGNVTLEIPNLTTTSVVDGEKLVSSGAADVLDIKADLDGIATTLMGLPPLGAELNAGIFSASYDLLSLEFGPVVEILQDFEAEVMLMADLTFSSPVFAEGEAQTVDFLSVPFNDIPRLALDFDQEVTVTPEFWLDANLTNTTRLGVDAEFVFEALKASLSLGSSGVTYDVGQVGPLVEYVNRFDVVELPALFEQNFAVGGFNRIVGASFSLSTAAGTGGGSGGNEGSGTEPAAPLLKDAAAELVTGSSVTLSQLVGAPVTDQFTLSFDYRFVENAGSAGDPVPTLDVLLAGKPIYHVDWTADMLGFVSVSLDLTTDEFFNELLGTEISALLEFVFDGPTGSVLLLDNVVFPSIVNGDFDLASLTSGLTGWTGTTSTAAGRIGVVVFETPIPGTLLLCLLPAGYLLTRRRRLSH